MEEEWDQSLSVPRIHSWWDIIAYIKEYGELTPQQLKFVIEAAKKFSYINYESLLDEGLNKYPELVNMGGRLILEMVKSNPWDFVNNVDRYLALEKAKALDPHILQDYQRLLVQYIMAGLKRWRESSDDASWFYLFRDAIRTLYLSSTKFPRNLLDGLIKRFGVDEYHKFVASEKSGQNWMELIKQPVLSQWDVSIILDLGTLTKDVMEQVTQKADAKAREYLRSFVYWAGGRDHNAPNTYFILDEELHPMNMFMEKREWPATTYPMHFDWLSDEMKQVWGPIVADFGLVMR